MNFYLVATCFDVGTLKLSQFLQKKYPHTLGLFFL